MSTFELPPQVIGWIRNHVAKNYWRMASWYDYDDLIQDGILCAYKCINKYGEPGKDIDPPHFMRLVQTAFHNHIGESLRHSHNRFIESDSKIADLSSDLSEEDILDRISPGNQADQDFIVEFNQLPKYIKNAVRVFFEYPEKMLKPYRETLTTKETFETRLNKMSGFPLDKDFQSEVENSFDNQGTVEFDSWLREAILEPLIELLPKQSGEELRRKIWRSTLSERMQNMTAELRDEITSMLWEREYGLSGY